GRAMLRSRATCPRRARRGWTRGVPEDQWFQGSSALCPARRQTTVGGRARLRARAGAATREGAPRARRLEHEEGAAHRQGARRLVTEQRREDDDPPLFTARAARADGVDS